MDKADVIYGTRAVMEAVRSGRQVDKVYLQTGINNDLVKELVGELRTNQVPFSWVPPEKINRMTSKNHQGVVAVMSAVTFASLQSIIDHVYSEGKTPLIVLMDRVTDVRNFGAVARSCECGGVDALVMEEKGNAPVTSDAVKTSAGALHHLPVCRVSSMTQTVKALQENGIHVVACTEKTSTSLFDVDLTGPVALLLGSEEDGIADGLLKTADTLAALPIKGKIESLNVSVAAGIAIYEAVRQRSQR